MRLLRHKGQIAGTDEEHSYVVLPTMAELVASFFDAPWVLFDALQKTLVTIASTTKSEHN